jgi:Anticodon binding domain
MASVSVMTVPGKARYVGTRIAISPIGKLAQPPRAALTGQTTSPGMFDVFALLGRGEGHARKSASAAASAGKV